MSIAKAKPEIRAQAQGLRFIVSNGFWLTICFHYLWSNL